MTITNACRLFIIDFIIYQTELLYAMEDISVYLEQYMASMVTSR